MGSLRNDAAEESWVVSTFASYLPVWIGLNDQAPEGTFVWVSGEPVTYLHWRNSGEPNGGTNENHVYLDPGGMVDYDCCDSLYGLVKVPIKFRCEYEIFLKKLFLGHEAWTSLRNASRYFSQFFRRSFSA